MAFPHCTGSLCRSFPEIWDTDAVSMFHLLHPIKLQAQGWAGKNYPKRALVFGNFIFLVRERVKAVFFSIGFIREHYSWVDNNERMY